MFVKISKNELKNIKQALPFLNKLIERDDSILENGTYKLIFISVFDHWLNDDYDLIFVDNNLEELNSRRQKFKNFITEVYKQTELYSWKFKRHHRIYFQKPESLKDILRKCNFENQWSEQGQRYSFLIPEYDAVYQEEFDWTNIIWYRERGKIEPLLQTAKKAGLHILEKPVL